MEYKIPPLIHKAIIFASKAHAGQVRKYTGEMYIKHCDEVANIIKDTRGYGSQENIATAYLHDTVEDTDTSFSDIEHIFGMEIARNVFYLTDVSRPEHGNRKIRKNFDRLHLVNSRNIDVFMIKCADLISNTSSIVQHDPSFAKFYMLEKEILLQMMVDAIPVMRNMPLWKRASSIVKEYKESC